MYEDLQNDLVTPFTSFSCCFESQEGTLNVAGHVVEFKSKYSDRKFDIPTDRIRVFKSKKEPKLKLDKQPKEEEGKATDKNTESFLLTFTNADDCEKCKELIATYMTRAEKRKKQSHEGNKQLKLLASDAFLKKVYDEMVGGGIIKKEEFWAQRKYLISSSALTASDSGKGGPIIKEQREGLKNYLFCSDDHFVSSVRTDQETTITLSKRKVQQIFTEHPGVYQYYKKVVPTQMNEKEFWAKFMKSYFFRTLDPVHSAMGNTTSSYSKTDVDDPLEHYEREMNKEFDEKAKNARVNPLVNIAAEDIRDGYGIRRDELIQPSKLAGFPESLKNLNRKSSRITQYAFTNEKPGESISSSSKESIDEEKILLEEREKLKEMLEYEDLKGEANVEYIPLKIQDKNRYFEGLLNEQAPTAGTISKKITSYPLREMRKAFNEELGHLKENLNLESAIIDSKLATVIYREISNQIIQSGDRDDKNTSGNSSKIDVEHKFREVFELVHELLRHLWSLLSLTKNEWKPQHTEKSEKIIQKLNEKREILKTLGTAQTNQWVKSLSESIQIALEHFSRMKQGNPNITISSSSLAHCQTPTTSQFRTVEVTNKASTTPQQTTPQPSPQTPQTNKPTISVNLSANKPATTPLTKINLPTPSRTPLMMNTPTTPSVRFSLPSKKGIQTPSTPSTPSNNNNNNNTTTTTTTTEPAQKKIKMD